MLEQDHDVGGAVPGNETDNSLDVRGLCLLSLDGGGVRGLSTLYILRALMQRLNDERREAKLGSVKPCEIFDLIGGTSTGGLIAIMLGRLEMSVDECIDAYKELMKTVFEKKKNRFAIGIFGQIKSRFSSKTLEKAVKGVIKKRGIPVDESFCVKADDEESRKCRVFVCCKAQETNYIAHLRSYPLKGVHEEPATIWEAALATSAATSFFDPVQIGDRLYVDGALGANNPASEVEKEANDIWCEVTGKLEPLVKCFISVGTGNGGINPISDQAWKFLTENLKKVATDTRETEEAVSSRWRGHWNKRYFRFNVHQGLQEVGLAEYKHGGLINAATAAYLESQDTKPRLLACVTNLRGKKYPPNQAFQLERAQCQAQEDRASTQNAPNVITATEISELIDRANMNLKRPRDAITHTDLINAYNDFVQVLHAKRERPSPPVKPKEFAYLYNKLMSTCLALSHFLNFTPAQRMAYVNDADRFAKRALEYAIKSGNNDRVIQMEFYLACVKARNIQLRTDSADFESPTASEREDVAESVSVAWGLLRSVENLDLTVYDAMAKETLNQLR
ncbi:hypothetical protein PV08_05882 [Exophiala spinifera]|uniref:PNPLA domain-containing protein n=1 Tax=Exophiala spinifera TaxID=91928 RepID=A0A0D1ZSM4_9EURO|nr:uncharacterized protein PV08_05882 [Exophiala spinifera]KIW15832.1 hypothetical protein PV08_05882 [Exophiala spinifera]